MHPYGIDTNERRNLLIILVPFSFWASNIFVLLWDRIGLPFPELYDWIFDFTSATAWFGVLYLWLENKGWKWRLFRKLRLIATPDLNGKWRGKLQSSYSGADNEITPFEREKVIDLEIKQSWSRVVVEARTEQSTSRSETASIFVDGGINPILVYTYLNRPKPDQTASMEMHAGTTSLELERENGTERLAGQYYNGRGRGTHGLMRLVRQTDFMIT